MLKDLFIVTLPLPRYPLTVNCYLLAAPLPSYLLTVI
jgi:hypothetical protein